MTVLRSCKFEHCQNSTSNADQVRVQASGLGYGPAWPGEFHLGATSGTAT